MPNPMRFHRRRRARAGRLAGVLLGFGVLTDPLAAQNAISVSGLVTDRDTGAPVEDAGIRVLGTDIGILTDQNGSFRLPGLPAGTYRLRITHLAYGSHSTEVELGDGDLALRIALSPEAIELDRIVVTGETEDQRDLRTRGTSTQVVTREEIEELIPTSRHIGDVLRQRIPGIRSREAGVTAGEATCIEFRTVGTPRFGTRCKTPVLIVDGVRVFDPPSFYNMLDLEQVQRVEVVPPSAAGLRYGTESAFGVIVVETRMWADASGVRGLSALPAALQPRRTYDWSVEQQEHSTARVFALAALGNLVGLAAGLAVANDCIEFSELAYDLFSTNCEGWATARSRVAALSLPLLGVATATRFAGGTSVSHGKFAQTMLAAAFVLIPGYALSTSGSIEGFGATRWTGRLFLGLGVPAAATVVDRMLRTVREP